MKHLRSPRRSYPPGKGSGFYRRRVAFFIGGLHEKSFSGAGHAFSISRKARLIITAASWKAVCLPLQKAEISGRSINSVVSNRSCSINRCCNSSNFLITRLRLVSRFLGSFFSLILSPDKRHDVFFKVRPRPNCAAY